MPTLQPRQRLIVGRPALNTAVACQAAGASYGSGKSSPPLPVTVQADHPCCPGWPLRPLLVGGRSRLTANAHAAAKAEADCWATGIKYSSRMSGCRSELWFWKVKSTVTCDCPGRPPLLPRLAVAPTFGGRAVEADSQCPRCSQGRG